MTKTIMQWAYEQSRGRKRTPTKAQRDRNVRHSTQTCLYEKTDKRIGFRGRRAFDLYLKCLQLTLQQQVWFMVQDRGLPAELETVVFDLWALRIAQLRDKIASADQDADSEAESQVFSTIESKDLETTDDEQGTGPTRKSREAKLDGAPNLYDCLALCYLGISTMRLPVTPGDMYAWVTDGKMTYRRAIKLVPLTMRDRLPAAYRVALDPRTMMGYKRFYSTLSNLQISFAKDYGIIWPPINAPVLLFRYLKELALPLELYDATLRLADLIGYDFAFHYDNSRQLGIRDHPEAQIAACLVVCTKLFYPFDKTKRYPISSSEPAATAINWKQWSKATKAAKATQRTRTDNKGFTTKELTQLKEDAILDMQPEQLDQYLDFYTATFLDDAETERREDNDFRRVLHGLFPIESSEQRPPVQLSDGIPHEAQMETVRTVQATVQPRQARDAKTEVLRPGQLYTVWRKEEHVPQRAKKLYDEVARVGGLSMEMLVSAVALTEARVEKWKRKQKEGTRGGKYNIS
jgi:RNA polymerase I-specific transcription initiation factor RRN7